MPTISPVEASELQNLDFTKSSLCLGVRTSDGLMGEWVGLTLAEWKLLDALLHHPMAAEDGPVRAISHGAGLQLLSDFARAAAAWLERHDVGARQ